MMEQRDMHEPGTVGWWQSGFLRAMTVCSLAALALSGSGAVWALNTGRPVPLHDLAGNLIPHSFAKPLAVEKGGIPEEMFSQKAGQSNPGLLLQRGAGISYPSGIPTETVTMVQTVSDIAAEKTLLDGLTGVARDRMAADGVPGIVIVLLRNGKQVGTAALGLADPSTGRVMNEKALFRVESIAKPVTAWGTMRLAETGRLDLDAPVSICLTRWKPPDATPPITVRQLLSHDAGIGLGDFTARYEPDVPRPELVEHLADDFRMIAAPGDGFAYSDTGFALLELVIEDCAGEAFAAFMEAEVLRPLGMAGASFDWKDLEMPVGHDLRGMAVGPYVYPGRGSGGLFATAADIASFAAAGMVGADQNLLSSESVAAMHRPIVEVDGLFGIAADGYGLGHFAETLSDGRAAVWHGGQGYGWMSHMHLVPETGDGIVILSNSQRAWPLFAVILRDWSKSLGVAPVGMARVLWAESAARGAIALALAIAGLAFWIGLRARPRPRTVRVTAGGIAGALILWPLWAAEQDYLFLFSILPGLWPWLGAVSGLAGLGLAALAMLPERPR